MNPIIEAKGLVKRYGKFPALDGVDFSVQSGAITGLIGPNGAGKTTTLKALTGLCDFEGELSVVGRDPRVARHKLMEDVCFIADVGILPKWMKVSQTLEYVEAVHPGFDRSKAERFLSTTQIAANSKIKSLSKGMITQLHLAIVMAIEVQLLVLDEPTLGLDIIYRKEFYDRLLNDYFDSNRTVIISTHQVEEIETLLSHLIFINRGQVVLDIEMSDVNQRFVEIVVNSDNLSEAMSLKPLYTREIMGKRVCIFDGYPRDQLAHLGELHTPGVSDLFVATMKERRLGEGEQES